MPWKETCAMDQRVQFVSDYLSGDYSKSALCDAYGISRPTGDKWLRRYEHEGVDGLKERSRSPHRHPNVTPEWVCQRIVEMKLAHQCWGPKKVVDRLREIEPSTRWPAVRRLPAGEPDVERGLQGRFPAWQWPALLSADHQR